MAVDIQASQFEQEVLQSDTVVMVDFYSTYCEPCKRLAPIVEELAKEYEGKLKVVKFNIDHGPEVVGQYGIMGVPSIFFFKGGEIVKRLSGFQPKEVLKEAIEEVL